MESNYKTQLTVRLPKKTYEELIEIHRHIYPLLSLNKILIVIIEEYYEEIFKAKKNLEWDPIEYMEKIFNGRK